MAVMLLVKPKWYILGVIALSPIINIFWFYQVAGFSVIDIFSGVFPLLFIIILFDRLKDRQWIWGRYNKYFILILIAYLIPIFFRMIVGLPLRGPFEAFLKISWGYASYNLFINLFESNEQENLKKSIFYAVAITMVMVSYQLITGVGTGVAGDRYIQGFYSDPGQYSRMGLIGVTLILPALKHYKDLFKFNKDTISYIFKLVLFFLSIITLVLAISRNALLAAVVVLIVYALLFGKFYLPLMAIPFGLVLFVSSPTVQTIYEDKLGEEILYVREYLTLKELRDNPSARLSMAEELRAQELLAQSFERRVQRLGSGRVAIWLRTIDEFKLARPFIKIFGRGESIGPHGQFFGLLRSVGIFGLVVSVLFYSRLFIDTLKKVRRDKDNLNALYGFLLIVVVFVMSIGASPLLNFYLQSILFAFIAFTEKEDLKTQNGNENQKDHNLYSPHTSTLYGS